MSCKVQFHTCAWAGPVLLGLLCERQPSCPQGSQQPLPACPMIAVILVPSTLTLLFLQDEPSFPHLLPHRLSLLSTGGGGSWQEGEKAHPRCVRGGKARRDPERYY